VLLPFPWPYPTPYQAPFSSRVTAITPFFPFTKLEQAIVAATHLYGLQKQLAADAPKDKERLQPSNIKLIIKDMGKVSMVYAMCTGAMRSLVQGDHSPFISTGSQQG
jgi:hypothetical protein